MEKIWKILLFNSGKSMTFIHSLQEEYRKNIELLETISAFYPILRMHVELILSQELLKTCTIYGEYSAE